jgi:multicomponent Na+:H+ antiporter subunit D
VALARVMQLLAEPVSDDVLGWLGLGIAMAAAAGAVLVSLQAIVEQDLRRMLALSALGQMGLAVIGLAAGSSAGITAATYHLVAHTLMTGAGFLAASAFAVRAGVRRIDDLSGLISSAPFSTIGFTLSGLSIIGLPLTLGFLTKWRLLEVALAAEWWWAAGAIVLTSLFAIMYIGRVLERLYLRRPTSAGEAALDAPALIALPMVALGLAGFFFGLEGHWAWALASQAGDALATAYMASPIGPIP